MSYFDNALHPERRRLAVATFREALSRTPVTFDTIAGRGVSGITMASIFAYELDAHLCVVRKQTNSDKASDGNPHCHDYVRVAHNVKQIPQRVLIVDDFICTGATIDRTIEGLRASNSQVEIVGIYLYESMMLRGPYKNIPVISPKWNGYPPEGGPGRYTWESV